MKKLKVMLLYVKIVLLSAALLMMIFDKGLTVKTVIVSLLVLVFIEGHVEEIKKQREKG